MLANRAQNARITNHWRANRFNNAKYAAFYNYGRRWHAWCAYDAPIYTGYANLTPDHVIVNVQFALRDQGYYAGAADGVIGPETRAGVAAYQADNGLAVISAIDSPTLATLGVA